MTAEGGAGVPARAIANACVKWTFPVGAGALTRPRVQQLTTSIRMFNKLSNCDCPGVPARHVHRRDSP
jgi:hypothetical protein